MGLLKVWVRVRSTILAPRSPRARSPAQATTPQPLTTHGTLCCSMCWQSLASSRIRPGCTPSPPCCCAAGGSCAAGPCRDRVVAHVWVLEDKGESRGRRAWEGDHGEPGWECPCAEHGVEQSQVWVMRGRSWPP